MKDSILQLRSQGKTYNEICKILNCSKGNVSYHCSDKVKENFKAYRRKNRKKQIIELKTLHGGKCKICGYDKCLDALHFHHIDPSKKEGMIGNLFNTKGKAAAFKEAEKCQLICANCHAELHSD